MPLTSKGEEIKSAMEKPLSEGGYGKKKGESVFYASRNKGTITGVDDAQGPENYKPVNAMTLADIQAANRKRWEQPGGSMFLNDDSYAPVEMKETPSTLPEPAGESTRNTTVEKAEPAQPLKVISGDTAPEDPSAYIGDDWDKKREGQRCFRVRL